MDGLSLKSRAITFALCAGAVVFILALLASSRGNIVHSNPTQALIAAIICAVMCWASAERSISSTAGALDLAIERLLRAAEGDLESEIHPQVTHLVPQLATAMRSLFGQLATNLDNVHRLAMFDSVTGLANRTNFRCSTERILTDLPGNQRSAIFFIDLDRFKLINDALGHAAGDMLLAMVANRLRAVVDTVVVDETRRPPMIGRLAGDEFTVFYPELRSIAEADRIGRAIVEAIAEPFEIDGRAIEIGASVGIASRPDHGTTLTELMRAADEAMYHAKAQGRCRAEHYTEVLAAGIAKRLELERELRTAIAQNEFGLVFQPQVALRGGAIVAAEALLRWNHPQQGLRLPGSFIARAEETGLIVEIGEWVVETVAATIARWAENGASQRLAINVSPRQIDHADFFIRLRAAMLRHAAPAALLELELTESLAMSCDVDVLAAVAALRANGATIAIDDFGTGYSNLTRLRALPIDRIKLDRSLIAPIAHDAEARTIIQAVIGLIHGLGCEAVAEGVETPAQADILRVIGCDVMQGYSIAQPMDEVAFLAWTRTGRASAAFAIPSSVEAR